MQEQIEQTIQYIRNQSKLKPRIGVILGSGLGAFADQIQVEKSLEFSEIPHFAPTTVQGHSGRLILGHLHDQPIVALSGRLHFYEGHSMERVVFPTRILAMLGIEILVLTNSAGGLDPLMNPGDFMIIEDHINMMGTNPLMGPNLQDLGPRFPDMTEAYDLQLREKLESILQKKKVTYHRGVYCGVTGPTYETPAEVRFLRMIGGSAVGMSTIPEVIAANHLGLRVCAVSCITNLASGLSAHKLTHDEVTETAKTVEIQFSEFMSDFVAVV